MHDSLSPKHIVSLDNAFHFSNFDYCSLFCSEVILTLGHSKFVKEFLCAAKEKKRSFQVFIAEGAPKYVIDANQSIPFYGPGKSFLHLFFIIHCSFVMN